MDRLLERGKVVFRRAYCDWSRFREATRRLHDFGVELIDVPPSTRAGKNGADMRLVIDALELCYAREHIDTFAIASGDSDFCPLAYKLRENNRLVTGLGVKEATSPLFVKACDEFIYLMPPRKEKAPPREEHEERATTPRARLERRETRQRGWRRRRLRRHLSVLVRSQAAAVASAGWTARCGVALSITPVFARTLITCQVGSISNQRAAKSGLIGYLWWLFWKSSPM